LFQRQWIPSIHTVEGQILFQTTIFRVHVGFTGRIVAEWCWKKCWGKNSTKTAGTAQNKCCENFLEPPGGDQEIRHLCNIIYIHAMLIMAAKMAPGTLID